MGGLGGGHGVVVAALGFSFRVARFEGGAAEADLDGAVGYKAVTQGVAPPSADGGTEEAGGGLPPAGQVRRGVATRAIVFRDLLDSHEKNRRSNWGKQYLTTWNTFRKLVLPLESESVLTLSASFWNNWLNETASKEGWIDRTVNDYTSLLSSVWKHGVSQELCEKNPIDGVTRRKIRRTQRPVYSVKQVKAILNAAWKYDRDLVPFFAITIFAGVRPDIYGEIGQLEWKDVNFGKKWIRVAANFDNKTNSKRFVPMESNLLKWLEPWKNAQGPILPKNFVKRRRYLTRGKYQSPKNAPETEWKELVPFGLKVRDITRHTYGSFLEAKYGDRNVVKENMGHSDFETYEQHYRNAQTPEDAKKFWAIEPPKSATKKSYVGDRWFVPHLSRRCRVLRAGEEDAAGFDGQFQIAGEKGALFIQGPATPLPDPRGCGDILRVHPPRAGMLREDSPPSH